MVSLSHLSLWYVISFNISLPNEFGVDFFWIEDLYLLLLLMKMLWLHFESLVVLLLVLTKLIIQAFSCSLLNLLLGTFLMFKSHMQNSGCLCAKCLVTMETLEVLLDLIGHPSMFSLAFASSFISIRLIPCIERMPILRRHGT